MFVTATSYTQLAIAMLLYLPLAYFALQVFPRGLPKGRIITVEVVSKTTGPETAKPKKRGVDIRDTDKRAFLKLIGAAGISYFLFSLLGRRVDLSALGRAVGLGTDNGDASPDQEIAPAGSGTLATDGYKISEIEEGVITYYGFVNKNGGWFIMREDTNAASFRYARGDFGFPSSWTKREQLKYSYYHNAF
jgi:hypothetical protein